MLAHSGDCAKEQQPADDTDLTYQIFVIRHFVDPKSSTQGPGLCILRAKLYKIYDWQ